MPVRLTSRPDPPEARSGHYYLPSPATGKVPPGTTPNFINFNPDMGFNPDGSQNLAHFLQGTSGGGIPRLNPRKVYRQGEPVADQAYGIGMSGLPPLPMPKGASQQAQQGSDPTGDLDRWRQAMKDWKLNGMVGPRPTMPDQQQQMGGSPLSQFVTGGIPGVMPRVDPRASLLLRMLMGRR